MSARLSFEFFPPQSIDASFRLWDTVRELEPLRPDFVSLTYGAGGTTRELTHDAARAIASRTDLTVAAHLTCVGATREETLAVAEGYAEAGISQIVALRGDPPKGAGKFTPHPGGFASSVDLVAALAETGKFEIRVGAYPDPHPDAPHAGADVEWLKRKIDAGAGSAITQFFFEPETFFRFRDACAKAGIDAPIIPGILPVENWSRARSFATRCGTVVPAWLDRTFEGVTEPAAMAEIGADLAIDMCRKLIDGGVEDLHFYTLNKSFMTRRIAAAIAPLRAVA